MKKRLSQISTTEESQIELTPMLDVVFIMLIFFIVTTSFVKESGIEVSRPNADTAEQQERASIFIAIDSKGHIFLQKRKIDIDAVRANIEKLHAESPEGSVVIQADKQSETGILVQVMDQIRLAGVENISIAASSSNN
ncbi:MAG: biopolymer transporter ExbD [Bdellovibrionaceae bacterium]|nr:biopolymer transporter ExbD [Pseudobdellovibrionaceae bacterium]